MSVPEFVGAVIDARASQVKETECITRLIQSLRPIHPQAEIKVSGGFDKLPMERTEATEKLFRHAEQLAVAEGFSLQEMAVGGTGDGNIAATEPTYPMNILSWNEFRNELLLVRLLMTL